MKLRQFPIILPVFLIISACSFDYGDTAEEDSGLPDIVMADVEYVRVRGGDPQVRFRAELAERYEDRQVMELRNFTFEQFDHHGDEVNAVGHAGTAHVELDSGNINLRNGVSIAVESEDVTIETVKLDWKDKERILAGDTGDEVNILRENGTSFNGRGFTADARNRTWEFAGEVGGTYIHDDDEEETEGGKAGAGEVTGTGVSAAANTAVEETADTDFDIEKILGELDK
jgi:LPS export ABC transporter protein LptC